jgi:hypothetical protein
LLAAVAHAPVVHPRLSSSPLSAFLSAMDRS